jgi:hypothetical protein
MVIMISFTHVAEKFNENNFDFMLLISEIWQISTDKAASNYCKDIEEYFEEYQL